MASYYSQVEEAIKNNEQELRHLNEELRGLRTVEKDTPRESYQRQHAQILYHIEQEQSRLKQNQELLSSYDAAHDAIAELRVSREDNLDSLRALLATERDFQIRREITEEIEAKEKEHAARIAALESTVTTNMAKLTDELREELRASFLEEETKVQENVQQEEQVIQPEITPVEENPSQEPEMIKETEDQIQLRLQSDYDKASAEYDEARRIYAESIAEFQRIFTEERTRREQEGPFATEEELDAFIADYMRQKISEDERFQDASRRMTQASRRMSNLDRRLREHATSVEKAASLNISVEEYTRIKKTVERKEVLSAIYEQRGLGEVNRRTKVGKETAREVSDEVIERLVEEFRENKSKNIIETINVIYGTDIHVRSGSSRQTTITEEEKENVVTNQRVKVKVRKVTHNNEVKDQEPVKGPPILTEEKNQNREERPTLISNQEQSALPPAQPTEIQQPEPQIIPTIPTIPREVPSSADSEGTTNPQQPSTEVVDLIPRGMNSDGTYRLLKDDIIQDDLASPRKPGNNPTIGGTTPQQETSIAVIPQQPTGMVPYKEKETSLVPIGQTKGESKPAEPVVQVHKPIQVLYGPPPIKEEIIENVPEKKPEEQVAVPPVQVLYGPPKNDEKEIIDIYKTPPKPIPTPPTPGAVQAEPEKPKQPAKPKRGLLTIIDGLTEGLELGRKDGKRLRASNIKCVDEFRQELSSGNYLYNIVHLVPAIVKLPFKLIQKVSGKLMLSADAKENAKTLKERLAKLSEEDLMTLYTEYRGNRVIQERFPTILNTLINERIQEFAMSKVTTINSELEARYSSAFSAIRQLEAIDRSLANPNISEVDRKNLEDYRKSLLSGQAENIKAIRQGYIDANGWLSGGAHGFEEDMKASATKLSVVGKRFAKDHDLDNDLLHRQAQLERAEMKAIADGNDEMALRTFVQAESLLSANTEINGSVFGRRSEGKKYYSPLAEQLDYRDDPFVRDLFTTIAISSAAVNAVKSVTHSQSDIMAENQRIMDENNRIMDQVNQMGTDIAGKRGVMMEGMEAQGMSDTLNGANEIERAVLDETGWGLGTNAYRTADNAGHTYYTDFYTATKSSYENIAQQYAAGTINQAQAMQMISDLTSKTHMTFGKINDACLDILKPYAQSHPQFDLSGVEGAMTYLQQNPDAISAMNQAMVDVTNAGDILASLQLKQLVPLTELPSTIRTTVINAAATAALASNISSTMGAKKHVYGNEVTEMVGEYVESQSQQPTNANTQTR